MTLHPNLLDHWFEWSTEGDGSNPRPIVVLETDAQISPASESVDSGVLDDMIDAVRKEYEGLEIARFRIVQAGRGT